MTFKIPDLKELAVRARNAFNAELKGTDAWLWPNNVYVSAKVFAGIVWQIFGRLKWIDKQRFVHSATGNELDRHARDYGMSRKSATFAQGNIYVIADDVPSLPAGTRFTRSDGVTFDSTIEVAMPLGSSVMTVPVICTVAGKIGNTGGRTPLQMTISSSVSGVATVPTVEDIGIGQGADIEDDESLRERLLVRKRSPPMGGSETDYWQWAREIPGVSRVFVEDKAYGRGTVGLWFLMDGIYPNGIAQAVDVAAVQAHINAVKPVASTVIVNTPRADCVEVVVKGITPDTDAVRQAAALELQSVFLKMGGVSLSKQPVGIHQSWLWQAVSNATGERFHTIVAPLSDLTFAVGSVPCLAKVRFIK